MFSNPAARPDSRSSAGPRGANRTPLRTASSPTPDGPPHLCALAVSSDQPPRTGPPPQRLRRVHQQRYAGLPAHRRHLGHRLHGPHLVVGGLQTRQRGVGPQRLGVPLRADGALPADRHPGDRTAVRLVRLGRVQHRGVFDR
ncbi:hypothetical protein GCM10020295_61280 [Streptomyces cinereospinus]